MEPVRQEVELFAAVQALRHVVNQALHEGRHGGQFRHGRNAVAHADLNRSPARCRADVPADFVDRIDHAGVQHVADVVLVFGPVLQLERQAGGGQLLEEHGAVGGVVRVVAGPVGAGCADGLQVRDIGHESADNRHDVIAVGNAHVGVHAEDQHLPAPPLGAVDQLFVAVGRGDLLFPPRGEGVGSRAHDIKPTRCQDVSQVIEGCAQIGRDAGNVGMHPADDFDGVREHFAHDLAPEVIRALCFERLEDFRGAGCQREVFSIDDREFPFRSQCRLRGRGKRKHADILI